MRREAPSLIGALERGFFYGYAVVAAGFGVWLIGFGTYVSVGVFFKPMLAEFGWSRADTASAYSLGLIVIAFLTIAMGWLTDKLGPRPVVIFFGSFLGISYLLLARINTVRQFQLIFGLLASIGISSTSIPTMATLTRWFAKRRGLMTGIVQAGSGLGGFIFAPLIGWLIVSYGWRKAYEFIGIITLAGFTLSGFFLWRDPRGVGQLPNGADEPVVSTGLGANPNGQHTGLKLLEAIQLRQFWVVAGLYFTYGFLRSTFLAHTAAHVQDIGFSLSDGANAMALISVSSIIGRIGMGQVADAFGNRPTFMVSCAVTGISLTWGLITEDLWGVYLFGFLFGFGWGAQAVLRFALTSEVFGLPSVGLLMGVLGFADACSAAFGSYAAGYLFDIFSTYRPVFWAGIAFSTMGILLAGLLKPTSYS